MYCKLAYFISCIYPYLSNNFQIPGLLSFRLIFEETLEAYKPKEKNPKYNTKSNVLFTAFVSGNFPLRFIIEKQCSGTKYYMR